MLSLWYHESAAIESMESQKDKLLRAYVMCFILIWRLWSPEKVTTWKTSLEQSARLSLDLEIGSLCCFHCKDVLSFIWIWKSGTNCLIMAQVEEVDAS